MDEQKAQQYTAQVAEIAKYLKWPESGMSDPEGYNAHERFYIKNDQYTLTLTFNGWQNEGRIKIYGSVPNNGRRDSGPKSITVSQAKPAKRIAADIERRYLPDFIIAHERAFDYAAKEKSKADWLIQRTNLLSQNLTDSKMNHGNRPDNGQMGFYSGAEGIAVNVVVSGYTYQEIEVSIRKMTFEESIELTYFLNFLIQRRKNDREEAARETAAEEAAGTAFDLWLKAVDEATGRMIGLSIFDLPDADFMAMYESGMEPKEASDTILMEAGYCR